MKNRYSLSALVAAVLILPGLLACNGDVFIDDFAPDKESVLLSSDGHARVIDFKADNWDVFDVYTLDGDVIKGDVYDADGQRLGDDPMYVEPGWTKFVLDHPTVTLTVERTKGDKLRVTSTENASGQPFECFVDVGNDYDRRSIRVEVEPSEAYRLDSIVYQMNSWMVQDSVPWGVKSELMIPYSYEEPQTKVITPYDRQAYQLQFTCYEEDAFAIFGGEEWQVPVPDADEISWGLYMTDRKIPLDTDVHYLSVPDSLLDITEEVTVPANYPCVIYSRWWYKYYGVYYKAYASHPRTGRSRVIEGVLDLYRPQAYQVYIEPWN